MRHARTWWSHALAACALCAPGPIAYAQTRPSGTPAEMVASYDALADAILATHKTEKKLVRAILAASYGHAQSELARARQALQSNDPAAARTAVDNLALAVAQIGTEGDNAVAGVRKRLLEGGHHHNASGEAQGIYDQGYVIVTKAAKQAFLDASKSIAALAREPNVPALEVEWKKVEAAWTTHVAAAR